MLGQCLRPDVAGIDAKLSNALKLEAGTSGRSELASFSPSVGGLLSSQVAEDEREATMRECFSVAFDREVEYLNSLNIELTKDRKRQILADILVWAEITQTHYDAATRSFVLEPNQHDESFQRIGKFLKEAMAEKGLLQQSSLQ